MKNELIIINVLPKEMYTDCHIDGSVHVPYTQLATYAASLQKDQPIVVYCASYECSASRKAWELLHKMGFTQVYAYEGGMAEWFQKGLPSQGSCRADYVSKIHHIPAETGKIGIINVKELVQLMQKYKRM